MANFLNKKITLDKIVSWLPYVFFISILFESICFFTVGTFPITVTFVFSLLLLISEFIYSIRRKNNLKQVILGLLMIILMIIASLLSGEEIQYTSLLLYLYFALFYIFVNPKIEENKVKKTCKIFVILVSIFSIYGMYQFIVNNLKLSLPFKELIPTSLLTPNYNTIGNAYIGSLVIYRAHSIFLEPSTFSQLASVTILLIFYVIDYKKNKFIFYLLLAINVIGILTTLAGSGLIILFAGLIFLICKNWHYKFKLNMNVVYILVLLAIVGIVVLARMGIITKLLDYYVKRTSEMDSDVKGSGYYRFVIPFLAIFYTIGTNFFGYGAGNDLIVAHDLGSPEDFIPNGFGKITAEAGVLGLLLYLQIVFSLKPKKESDNIFKLLFVILIMYIFCGGAFTQTSFWAYGIFLKGITTNEKKDLLANSVIDENTI